MSLNNQNYYHHIEKESFPNEKKYQYRILHSNFVGIEPNLEKQENLNNMTMTSFFGQKPETKTKKIMSSTQKSTRNYIRMSSENFNQTTKGGYLKDTISSFSRGTISKNNKLKRSDSSLERSFYQK